MSTYFLPHGEFDFYVSNNVLIAKLVGTWNVECAKRFSESFIKHASPLIGKPWGHLVFLDDWQVSVPEMEPIITDLVTWCVDNGLQKSAQVYSQSMLKKYTLDKMVIEQSGVFDRQIFTEASSAIQWLNQYGFNIEKGIDIDEFL